MSVLTDTYILNNGVTIPKVGFGTWQIPSGKAAYDAVTAALADGYRHVDTAYAYGNETSVGQAIKDSGLSRDDVFITSKLPGQIKSADEVEGYFDETVSNLGVDYLDLYLIHAPWPWSQIGKRFDKENAAVWRVFEKLYRQGRIKSIGVSNFDVHDLTNLLDHTDVVPAVNQIQYYVGFTEPKISAFAQQRGILIEAYSPLATGGLLNNNDLHAIAQHYQVSVPQLALRFVLQNGALPLPKGTSPEHIEANTKLDFTISDQDMTVLRDFADAAPSRTHNQTQG